MGKLSLFSPFRSTSTFCVVLEEAVFGAKLSLFRQQNKWSHGLLLRNLLIMLIVLNDNWIETGLTIGLTTGMIMPTVRIILQVFFRFVKGKNVVVFTEDENIHGAFVMVCP